MSSDLQGSRQSTEQPGQIDMQFLEATESIKHPRGEPLSPSGHRIWRTANHRSGLNTGIWSTAAARMMGTGRQEEKGAEFVSPAGKVT